MASEYNIQQEEPAGGARASRMLFDDLSRSWDITGLSSLLNDLYKAGVSQSEGRHLTAGRCRIVSDFELLKLLLNIKALPGDMMLQFAMSFWIRHNLVQLFLIQCCSLAGETEKEKIFQMARSCNIESSISDQDNPDLFASECFALFSARGIHLYPAGGPDLCRYADVYDEFRCSLKTKPGKLYCEEHEKNTVYDINSEDRLAKLFRYYGSCRNFEQADEKELRKQLNSFLQKLSGFFKERPGEEELRAALNYYNYSSASDLEQSGPAGLRKRFTGLAFQSHPDSRTTSEDTETAVRWNEAHQNYRILRDYLNAGS